MTQIDADPASARDELAPRTLRGAVVTFQDWTRQSQSGLAAAAVAWNTGGAIHHERRRSRRDGVGVVQAQGVGSPRVAEVASWHLPTEYAGTTAESIAGPTGRSNVRTNTKGIHNEVVPAFRFVGTSGRRRGRVSDRR